MKVKISEIVELRRRLSEINRQNLVDIEFLDDNDEVVSISESLIEEFLYTGLSNVDFITTNFYLEDNLTNEEKFIQLLKLSVKNGYSGAYWSNYILFKDNLTGEVSLDWEEIEEVDTKTLLIRYKDLDFGLDSINDLIVNFGKKELCFIDALLLEYVEKTKDFERFRLIFGDGTEVWITEPSELTRDLIINYWVNLETERRLIWFFELFDCLLCKSTKQ